MSEPIEFDLCVDKVTVAKGEDRVITVALKGAKAVLLDRDRDAPKGFELIDTVDVKLTLKCTMPDTVRQIGIDRYMNQKVVVLRDRDMSLSGCEVELHPAVQQKIA